ncbi:MAG: glycogen synthase [Mucilaginibacter sp.]|nr:glycogen synthase [Mucilaginibacter sp.]
MKNKPQTLVILSPGFPANEADTSCMPPQQLFVKALKEICPGLNVIVLAFQYPFTAGEYLWHGAKVIAIGGKSKSRLKRIKTWLKAWTILKKLNKEHQLIGLLSFWMGECALVGNYFAKRHKLNHYSWVLGQDARRGNKYFKWIKPKSDTLIALSDFIAKEIKKNHGVIPLQVISVGIDPLLFPEIGPKRDIDILGAGSLIPLKQYSVFVEVVSALKEFYPNIKAVLCGKGPEMDSLMAMCEAMDLKNNVSFAGELPHQNVLALMQRSKVFLHPSSYEGFGAVLSEALYAGAHVVSFCKPMNKNYRHHYVVNNKEEMSTEVLSILKNTRRDHDRVLVCPIQQIAKNMISLFVV